MAQQSLLLRIANMIVAGVLIEALLVVYAGRMFKQKFKAWEYNYQVYTRWCSRRTLPVRQSITHKAYNIALEVSLNLDTVLSKVAWCRALRNFCLDRIDRIQQAYRALSPYAENPSGRVSG